MICISTTFLFLTIGIIVIDRAALFRQIATKRSLDRVTSTPVPNNRLVFSALIFGGTSTGARKMSCSREIEALKAKARSQPRQMTDDEWRLILTPEEYHVTRMKGTERPFSCARVNDNHQKGQYNCICCGVPLFTSGVFMSFRQFLAQFTLFSKHF